MGDNGRGPAAHHTVFVAVVATLGLAAVIVLAGCSGTPAAPTAATTSGEPTPAVTPAGPTEPTASAATATVTVSSMATSRGEVPDFCPGASGTYNDDPNRYSFSIMVAVLGNADATDEFAPALLGKVAHLTLEGPPDAGAYDAPIVHGPGGAGLSLVFTGVRCKPDGFSTLGAFAVDGLPLTLQQNGTRLGTITIP